VGAAPAGGARRRQSSAGRGALAPASFRPGQGSGAAWAAPVGLVEVEEGLVGLAAGLNPELAAAAPIGVGGRLGTAGQGVRP
jgi:hypothetical protein